MAFGRLCVADLHLHTNLSACAPDTTTARSYLAHCEKEGIQKIGISNHLYADKGVEHILQIKNELGSLAAASPVPILVGCEAEVFNRCEPSLTKEEASRLDYVLLAPSHIFNMPHYYQNFDFSTPDKILQVMIENFKQACYHELGVPTAICHPLYPICAPNQQEILDGMTDEMLEDCFTLAAKQNKAIEIHACVYRETVPLDEEGLSPSYIRMLSIAKRCGCKFYFGTDAHWPETFTDKHALLERAAQRAGICKSDLWHLAQI